MIEPLARRSVETVAVLRLLLAEPAGQNMRAREIIAAADLVPSSAYRILVRMVERGWLVRERDALDSPDGYMCSGYRLTTEGRAEAQILVDTVR